MADAIAYGEKVASTAWVQRVMLDDAPFRDSYFEHVLRQVAEREGFVLAGPVTWSVLEPMEPFREDVVRWTEAGYVFVRAEAKVARTDGSQPEGSEG